MSLESIHRQFLASHRLPTTATTTTAPSSSRRSKTNDDAPSTTTAHAAAGRPPSLPSSSLSSPPSNNHFDKLVHLEGLKRKRMALKAAVDVVEECGGAAAATTTTLHADLEAQRKRQLEWSCRPYLRYLVSLDVSNSLERRGEGARTGGGEFPHGRRMTRRRQRRALDFIESSILFNELETQHEGEHRHETVTATDRRTATSGTERDTPTDAFLTERRNLRLLRRFSSSYLLLSGISMSLEDEGRVLALQFDYVGGELSRDEVMDDGDDSSPSTCCAFLQFVTSDAANRNGVNGRRNRHGHERHGESSSSSDGEKEEVGSDVYYLRLHSHTFPKPLVSRVTSLLGLVRVGPMKDAAWRDQDDADNTREGATTFLADFRSRVREVRRHLLAFRARRRCIAQLLAMDKRSQRKKSKQAKRAVPDAASTMEWDRVERSDKVAHSAIENCGEDDVTVDVDVDSDDETQTTAATAVAEDVTDVNGEVGRVSYHHVNRIVLDDQQIQFRLNCKVGASTGVPQPPKLVVSIAWPEQQPHSRPVGVSIAYHTSRSNQVRVRDTIHAVRERKKRRQCSSMEPYQVDDRAATSAAMAISSDEGEDEDESLHHPMGRSDPYLSVLQRAARGAFVDLPLPAAVEQLASKMKELVEGDTRS